MQPLDAQTLAADYIEHLSDSTTVLAKLCLWGTRRLGRRIESEHFPPISAP